MVLVGFKPDLNNQLVSFSALTLLVWSPVKIVPEITYYVSSGTLNPTHSLTHSWLEVGQKRCRYRTLSLVPPLLPGTTRVSLHIAPGIVWLGLGLRVSRASRVRLVWLGIRLVLALVF